MFFFIDIFSKRLYYHCHFLAHYNCVLCIPADPGDKEYPTEGSSYVVWAIGRLSHNKEPMFHDIYPKGNIKLEFNRKETGSNCFEFTRSQDSFR